MHRIRLWDLPTRLFHWLLAAAVIAAFITEKTGNMDAHAVVGLGVIGLLFFRIAWGFTGSTYARFTQFVRGPRAVRDYLQGRWQGEGHNPLGALSVLAFLLVLLLQVGSGVFANDDSTFFGPLYALVSRETSDLLTRIHRLQELVIIALVLLHVAAIVFYARVKKKNLLKPMITGIKESASPQAPDAQGGGWLAFVIALTIALAAVWAASGAWIPPAPPIEALPPAPSW